MSKETICSSVLRILRSSFSSLQETTRMSMNNRVEIDGSEFESEDLEYLMIREANKNIIDEEEDNSLLPDIICEEILMKLPAEYLYQELRLVCQEWKNIISRKNFILDHFSRTKPSFLVQCEILHRRSYQMEIDEKQLSYKMPEVAFNCMGRFRSSCYGMLLVESWVTWHHRELQVLNLVTKDCLTLPKCPSGCPHDYNCGSALGFDPCTNLFKVVHIHANKFGFELFTIGGSSNEWKTIPGPWKDDLFEEGSAYYDSNWSDPVSIKGRFLHWNVDSLDYIVSMDLSKEKCIKRKIPCTSELLADDDEDDSSCYYLLELGGHLALIYSASSDQMDIWILQDFHSKFWLKKHSVHAKMIISTINPLPSFRQITPVGSTSYGVLVFRHTKRRIYIYDMEKRTMKKHITKIEIEKLIVHRSSVFKLQQ